ncbi:MAG TPA: efflux RND transporter periplasmic adaptor subunit [Steroidobacteraceae bacterium]|jgi:multidrug efflux system membrane fusion protein|nr:efflux RND transporter periplasmic adaptor subunit [Steroidobacteraceae bacterium]
MSGEIDTQTAQTPRRSRPRLWLGVVATLACVAAVIGYLHQPAGAREAPRPDGPVPVQTALAQRSDVPLYLQGIGTVQAFYTATMTARVDGQLDSVHFTEGQLVKKGQLLAQIDPRPYRAALDQVMATEQKDAAQMQSAQGDLARYEELEPQHLSSKQQVDDQRALVAQLAAQVQIDRAAIDNARTQLAYTTITAPFDGRTGIRLVDPGNNVHATDTTGIVVVTQVQPISVVFTLPEGVLTQIQDALAAGPVSVTALSQDGSTVLDTGTLTVLDNQIDATTGTMRMKATFPNTRNRLWPGQFVNARVLAARERGVVTLPSAAVQNGPDGPFTYVVNANSTVEVRPLKLGEQSGDVTVVRGGLSAGERVVTSNQFRLEPGARVSIS